MVLGCQHTRDFLLARTWHLLTTWKLILLLHESCPTKTTGDQQVRCLPNKCIRLCKIFIKQVTDNTSKYNTQNRFSYLHNSNPNVKCVLMRLEIQCIGYPGGPRLIQHKLSEWRIEISAERKELEYTYCQGRLRKRTKIDPRTNLQNLAKIQNVRIQLEFELN